MEKVRQYRVVYRDYQTDELEEEIFYGFNRRQALWAWKKVNKSINKGRLISIHYVRDFNT